MVILIKQRCSTRQHAKVKYYFIVLCYYLVDCMTSTPSYDYFDTNIYTVISLCVCEWRVHSEYQRWSCKL